MNEVWINIGMADSGGHDGSSPDKAYRVVQDINDATVAPGSNVATFGDSTTLLLAQATTPKNFACDLSGGRSDFHVKPYNPSDPTGALDSGLAMPQVAEDLPITAGSPGTWTLYTDSVTGVPLGTWIYREYVSSVEKGDSVNVLGYGSAGTFDNPTWSPRGNFFGAIKTQGNKWPDGEPYDPAYGQSGGEQSNWMSSVGVWDSRTIVSGNYWEVAVWTGNISQNPVEELGDVYTCARMLGRTPFYLGVLSTLEEKFRIDRVNFLHVYAPVTGRILSVGDGTSGSKYNWNFEVGIKGLELTNIECEHSWMLEAVQGTRNTRWYVSEDRPSEPMANPTPETGVPEATTDLVISNNRVLAFGGLTFLEMRTSPDAYIGYNVMDKCGMSDPVGMYYGHTNGRKDMPVRFEANEYNYLRKSTTRWVGEGYGLYFESGSTWVIDERTRVSDINNAGIHINSANPAGPITIVAPIVTNALRILTTTNAWPEIGGQEIELINPTSSNLTGTTAEPITTGALKTHTIARSAYFRVYNWLLFGDESKQGVKSIQTGTNTWGTWVYNAYIQDYSIDSPNVDFVQGIQQVLSPDVFMADHIGNRLIAGSPAIGAGYTPAFNYQDAAGYPLQTDIGAYNFAQTNNKLVGTFSEPMELKSGDVKSKFLVHSNSLNEDVRILDAEFSGRTRFDYHRFQWSSSWIGNSLSGTTGAWPFELGEVAFTGGFSPKWIMSADGVITHNDTTGASTLFIEPGRKTFQVTISAYIPYVDTDLQHQTILRSVGDFSGFRVALRNTSGVSELLIIYNPDGGGDNTAGQVHTLQGDYFGGKDIQIIAKDDGQSITAWVVGEESLVASTTEPEFDGLVQTPTIAASTRINLRFRRDNLSVGGLADSPIFYPILVDSLPESAESAVFTLERDALPGEDLTLSYDRN